MDEKRSSIIHLLTIALLHKQFEYLEDSLFLNEFLYQAYLYEISQNKSETSPIMYNDPTGLWIENYSGSGNPYAGYTQQGPETGNGSSPYNFSGPSENNTPSTPEITPPEIKPTTPGNGNYDPFGKTALGGGGRKGQTGGGNNSDDNGSFNPDYGPKDNPKNGIDKIGQYMDFMFNDKYSDPNYYKSLSKNERNNLSDDLQEYKDFLDSASIEFRNLRNFGYMLTAASLGGMFILALSPLLIAETGTIIAASKGGNLFASQEKLAQHFLKHGAEFGNITEAQYLSRAQQLVNSKVGGDILTKIRSNGDILFYNKATNDFAVKSSEGFIRTLFKPSNGLDYFLKQ